MATDDDWRALQAKAEQLGKKLATQAQLQSNGAFTATKEALETIELELTAALDSLSHISVPEISDEVCPFSPQESSLVDYHAVNSILNSPYFLVSTLNRRMNFDQIRNLLISI